MQHDANHLPPIILNSVPKSGTHLLTRVFEILPEYNYSGTILATELACGHEDPESPYTVGVSTPRGIQADYFTQLMADLQPGQYHYGHIPCTPANLDILKKYGIRMVTLLRDPRALVCSFVHFILWLPTHPLKPAFEEIPILQDQIKLAIRGIKAKSIDDPASLLPISTCFKSIADWANWDGCSIVAFEELVGPKGGGSADRQQQAVNRILSHIGYPAEAPGRANLAEQLFAETSATFRKGQITGWQDDFTEDVSDYFNLHAGDSLDQFQRLFGQLFA